MIKLRFQIKQKNKTGYEESYSWFSQKYATMWKFSLIFTFVFNGNDGKFQRKYHPIRVIKQYSITLPRWWTVFLFFLSLTRIFPRINKTCAELKLAHQNLRLPRALRSWLQKWAALKPKLTHKKVNFVEAHDSSSSFSSFFKQNNTCKNSVFLRVTCKCRLSFIQSKESRFSVSFWWKTIPFSRWHAAVCHEVLFIKTRIWQVYSFWYKDESCCSKETFACSGGW